MDGARWSSQSLTRSGATSTRRCPIVKIEVLGPPPTSGTRDAFVELAMEGGAKKFDDLKALRKSDKKSVQGDRPPRSARTAPSSRPARTTT